MKKKYYLLPNLVFTASDGVLSGKFRHGHKKHKSVFKAVCVITQYQSENGHPLFDV
jgi:hypothetical protein